MFLRKSDDVKSDNDLIANAKIILNNTFAIRKTLTDMKDKQNPFVPLSTVTILIDKFEHAQLANVLNTILYHEDPLVDDRKRKKILILFSSAQFAQLYTEILTNFKLVEALIKDINLISSARERDLLNASYAASHDGIKLLAKMKESDKFIMELVGANQLMLPAIKRNILIANAHLDEAQKSSSEAAVRKIGV